MKEEYVFPFNNWYIEITNRNRRIINDWKIKQVWNKDLFAFVSYKYVKFDGSGYIDRSNNTHDIEITTEQFKQYILEEEILIINENYDYLTEIFKKLNIN